MTEALTAADHAEITMLYNQYAAALDVGDGAGRFAVFTADGLFASRYSDHEFEPASLLVETTAREPRGRRHLCYSIVVSSTENGAAGLCFLLYVYGFAELDDDRVIRGELMTYDDTLVRTPRGWRFQSRHVWPDSDPRSPYFGGRAPQSLRWTL